MNDWKKVFSDTSKQSYFFGRLYEEPESMDIFSQVHYIEELIFAWTDDAKDSG